MSATERCPPPRWPEPFRAAFALCPDVDDSNRERFEMVQELIRGDGPTPWGPGLGWKDFGDSCFGLTRNPAARARGQVSLFADEAGRELSDFSLRLETLLREGGVEALHTWGDYSGVGGFRREHAEAVVEWLRKKKLSVPVWINHGDDHNAQNLGALMGRGDDPTDGAVYCADLAREAGCRYYWIGDLSYLPGQGAHHSLRARLTPLRAGKSGSLRCLAFLSAALYQVTGRRFFLKVCHKLDWQFELETPLLCRRRLRDGSEIDVFTRYGRWDAADFRSLHLVLTEAALDKLVASGGAMILYTHLGRHDPTPEGVEALRRVERLRREGTLWVTSVTKLLDYYSAATKDGKALPRRLLA